MEFTKKNYTFRGMDGFAGFRHGQDYQLELAEVVIINPVSRLYMYCSKVEFRVRWEAVKK